MIIWFVTREVPSATVLLCDADGTLFPSEEPAFEASAAVTNRLLAELGVDRAYGPAELQRLTNGKYFRASVAALVALHDLQIEARDVDRWVAEENDAVTAHLRTVLVPDPDVIGPLTDLARRFVPAVVTSSASTRLDACLEVAELTSLFEAHRLFSAESSMARPVSKPDPAVYAFACEQLGVDPADAVAVEDSVNGARSAVAAGCFTIGTVQFVPRDQRPERIEALREAGVVAVVKKWSEIPVLLDAPPQLTARRDHAGAPA